MLYDFSRELFSNSGLASQFFWLCTVKNSKSHVLGQILASFYRKFIEWVKLHCPVLFSSEFHGQNFKMNDFSKTSSADSTWREKDRVKLQYQPTQKSKVF